MCMVSTPWARRRPGRWMLLGLNLSSCPQQPRPPRGTPHAHLEHLAPPLLGSRSLLASAPGLIMETPTQPLTLGLLRPTPSSMLQQPALLRAPSCCCPHPQQLVVYAGWVRSDRLTVHQHATHSWPSRAHSLCPRPPGLKRWLLLGMRSSSALQGLTA